MSQNGKTQSVSGYQEARAAAPQSTAAEAVWSFEATRAGTSVILPDGRCDVILRYKSGDAASVVPVVTGPATEPYEIAFEAEDAWIGVRMRPERGVSLWGARIGEAQERVLQGAAALELVPALRRALEVAPEELALRPMLEGLTETLCAKPADARVARALARIHQTGGQVLIEALADDAAVSARHLGRLFVGSVGVSAQAYCGVVRFHRALWLTMRGGLSLSAAAVEAGYADQAHLTRAVRRFAGVAPKRLPDDLILPELAGVDVLGYAP